MLYKGVADQIDSYSKMAVTEQQIATLGNLKKEVMYKHGMEVAKMQQASQKQAFDQAVKIAGDNIKRFEAQTKRLKSGETSKKDLYKIRENEVKVDGKTYYIAKGDRAAFQKGMKTATGVDKKINTIETLTGKVKWNLIPTGISAFYSQKGRDERAKLRTINKLLQGLAGSARVAIVGPGVVSETDMKILRNYFEVLPEGGFLKIVKPLGPRVWAKARKGEYKALIRVLRHANKDEKNTLKETYLPDYKKPVDIDLVLGKEKETKNNKPKQRRL